MDALREMRRLGFDMPLIIVTGNLGDGPAVDCVKGGAADYVLKGALARLPIAVKRAVEDKRARDSSRHNQTLMEQAQQEQREHEERFLQLADNIGIAHDFNNLLTVIMSYTDMLSERIPATDPRSDDLDQIRKAAVAASSLTRQLVALSRQQVIEPPQINLDDVGSPLPLGTETVLLAEDAAAVRAAARQILERSGYTVLEAPTGRDALNIASKRQAPIHLLLTDVVMPEMSGSELAEQFAEFRPASKVLYMSGYTDDAIVRHGILRPGIAYLQKPFSPDALSRKVREVLDSSAANGNHS
jgi:DNA-binding NtrC family response regulator